ncbi:MAG: radical SAM protein [Lachnospiraceae bacterium]|nr:radical SAM protein [Lachnospiraceae bacterium]
MGVGKQIKMAALSAVVEKGLAYLEKDPENNTVKLLDMIDKVVPANWYKPQRTSMYAALSDPNSNWSLLAKRIYALDPGVRQAFFTNFISNASLKGSVKQEATREKYNCNAPWAILLDPTSACNLRCTGCWAAEYGYKLNLTLDTINSIIEQGKEIGCYMYIYTGGEPLVRKADLIKLCEMHPDCEFLSFTNGTLIDEAFCQELLRVKNFVPAISLEGFEEANDSRRGEGVYQKVMNAMTLMKEHKLPFGISVCYTSRNYKDVSSDEFVDKIIDMGALFVWYFHYMPVGQAATPELMPKPDQRVEMIKKLRSFRSTKPIFAMDFQNDGEHVGGCIAGGRKYLHINAKGDVEPCVFIHYSNVNIHDVSLLDALRSPLFQAYHDNQPFNDNHLRPCPMLENPDRIRQLVKETGAVNTDYQDPESVDHLADKTVQYAENWAPVAKEIWAEKHPELVKEDEAVSA